MTTHDTSRTKTVSCFIFFSFASLLTMYLVVALPAKIVPECIDAVAVLAAASHVVQKTKKMLEKTRAEETSFLTNMTYYFDGMLLCVLGSFLGPPWPYMRMP